jgi:leucyl-tRNA synthetase
MFPYPSGATLHVGHPLGYIATDVYARFQRMAGRNVLHTLGYDAFGLPAEQYAVQTGRHPRATTEANIARMRRQLRRLGLGHDARRSVATTDPAFYRWTQWMFLQLFNAFYDVAQDRARPIAALVAELESGQRPVPEGHSWAELTELERRRLVDGHRLAYLADAPVNWAPGLGTVLADEEVTAEGRSDRGNFPVFRRRLRQWTLRITAYADRLLEDLDRLDWPESIKTMQRNWIGRSEGTSIRFAISGSDVRIPVFTTRPDTIFGATFLVLAPDHGTLDEVIAGTWPRDTPQEWKAGGATPAEAVRLYRLTALTNDAERQRADRPKTGVFTGAFAENPATGQDIPVFVADYVLAGYGTGAIMAVPAHDERDFEFASGFDLPVVAVVSPPGDWPAEPSRWTEAWTGEGICINSAGDAPGGGVVLDGLADAEAKEAVTAWLALNELGGPATTYKLRDWLFARQRYWGEPFPIVYDEWDMPVAVPEAMLPVELPELMDFSTAFDPEDQISDPEPPLARAQHWAHVTLDLGDGPRTYRRETNTMPQWAGSCWYELRYLDPTNDNAFCDPDVERYWMGPRDKDDTGGVDLYVGGVDQAVLHLLYARFWHKVLYDLGLVSSSEPFRRLVNQGWIQAWAYTDGRGAYVPAEEVVEVGAGAGAEAVAGHKSDRRPDVPGFKGVAGAEGGKRPAAWSWHGEPVTRRYGKMGKSLKNAVTPDELCDRYGADTLRLYEMSMGPIDTSRPWDTRAVSGSFRLLQRLWRNLVDEATGRSRVIEADADDATRRLLHKTIETVRSDYDTLRFNTAIAKLIELNNHLTRSAAVTGIPREVADPLVLMLAPVAPHTAEELWSRLGHQQSLAYEPFPVADAALLVSERVTCVVQVAGRVRDRFEVPASIGEEELRARALTSERVRSALAGRRVGRVVVRPPTLVNVVPGD